MTITIYELADLLDADLVVTRHPNQDGRWSARFRGCEVREGECILASTHGNDKSLDLAIQDYINQIVGKRVVFNAMSKDSRREFTVPKELML